MSKSTTAADADVDETNADELPADERAVFERLYERHDGDDIERIAATVLQSSSSTDSEEAN